jgi:hypothetical protein
MRRMRWLGRTVKGVAKRLVHVQQVPGPVLDYCLIQMGWLVWKNMVKQVAKQMNMSLYPCHGRPMLKIWGAWREYVESAQTDSETTDCILYEYTVIEGLVGGAFGLDVWKNGLLA